MNPSEADELGPASHSGESPGESLHRQALTTTLGTVALWRGGTGPSLLLLHDLGTTHASYEGIAQRLTDRFHVCAPDLLGHGSSSRDAADLTVASQCAALQQLVEDLHLEELVVVGHALGGSIALRLSASLPQRVRKVVLITAGSYAYSAPPGTQLLRSRTVWGLLGLLGRSTRRRMVARICGRAPLDESLDRWDSVRSLQGWSLLGRAFRQTTSPEAVSEMEAVVERYLRKPTLVIWGSDDEISPVAAARVLFQEVRDARLIEIAEGGHAPHERHPHIVTDLLREFLE